MLFSKISKSECWYVENVLIFIALPTTYLHSECVCTASEKMSDFEKGCCESFRNLKLEESCLSDKHPNTGPCLEPE
jgi:hypothetical protein